MSSAFNILQNLYPKFVFITLHMLFIILNVFCTLTTHYVYLQRPQNIMYFKCIIDCVFFLFGTSISSTAETVIFRLAKSRLGLQAKR